MTAQENIATAPEITWDACNASTFMTRRRSAKTLRAAVRDARRFLRYELYGEGRIDYYEGDDDYPIRTDEIGIRTGNRWVVNSNP